MGVKNDAAKVFILDLGLAKRYGTRYCDKYHGRCGTCIYASLHSHQGYGKAI